MVLGKPWDGSGMVEGLGLGNFWVRSPGVGSRDGGYEGSSADRWFGSSGQSLSKSLEKVDQNVAEVPGTPGLLGMRPGLGQQVPSLAWYQEEWARIPGSTHYLLLGPEGSTSLP